MSSETETKEKTGNEIVDEIAKEATLARFYDRNPNGLSDEDLLDLVELERKQRALHIEK